MSELVGNGPRTPGDIPGNSHRERKLSEPEPETPREKTEKVIEGKVVTRKQPWYKKVTRSLVADDAQTIGDFMVTEILVPSIKNLIADIVGQGTNRVLYGTARANMRNMRGERSGLRTRYDLMASDNRRQPIARDPRARHDFAEFILETHRDAVEVIEELLSLIDRYGSASVSDLHDLVGATGSFVDRQWGWRDLRSADVRQVRGGFLLDLPSPEPLR